MVIIKFMLAVCYELNVYVPQNSHMEALTHNVLVFESGPFGRKFGLDKVVKRAPMMGLLEEEAGPEFILCISLSLFHVRSQ